MHLGSGLPFRVRRSAVALAYYAGDTVAGESFTRASTASYTDANGIIQTAAINAKRDGHHIGGVRTLLLESAKTNAMLHSNDFTNAAWVKASLNAVTGVADPAGGTTASTLTTTAGNASAYQNIADGLSIVRTNSLWIRRRTGTSAVKLVTPQWSDYIPIGPITSQWARYTLVGTASITRTMGLQFNDSGDSVDVWCAQQDDAAFASSEITTGAAAVTRAADSYTIPGVTSLGSPRLYQRYYDLATAAWVESETAYVSGANIVLALDRAYTSIEVRR